MMTSESGLIKTYVRVCKHKMSWPLFLFLFLTTQTELSHLTHIILSLQSDWFTQQGSLTVQRKRHLGSCKATSLKVLALMASKWSGLIRLWVSHHVNKGPVQRSMKPHCSVMLSHSVFDEKGATKKAEGRCKSECVCRWRNLNLKALYSCTLYESVCVSTYHFVCLCIWGSFDHQLFITSSTRSSTNISFCWKTCNAFNTFSTRNSCWWDP